jgi:hypothetical protein
VSPHTKAAVVLVGTFLAGAVGGGAMTLHVMTRKLSALFEGEPTHTLARLYGAELDRRLGLHDGQRAEIESIVDADHAELSAVGQEVYPALAAIRKRRHARIREVLTPEQRTTFDAMVEANERRRRAEIDLPP